jgi:prophage regulatory protein
VNNVIYVSAAQLAVRYAVHVGTIWRWAQTNQDFPRPLNLSYGCTRWRLDEIEQYDAERVASSAVPPKAMLLQKQPKPKKKRAARKAK